MNAYRIRPLAAAEGHTAESGFAVEGFTGTQPQALGRVRVAEQIGVATPRFWFYVGHVAYRADDLPLSRHDRVLFLGNDYAGARELLQLQMDPGAPAAALEALLHGTLALLQALPEEAQHPLASRTIVELPGLQHGAHSPFWDGLCARFYAHALPPRGAPERARHEAAVASLLPRQPVVVSLLDQAAQDAIGAIDAGHAQVAAALARCGFRRGLHVNTCDGGPVFEAQPPAHGVAMTLAGIADTQATERWLLVPEGVREAWILPARGGESGLGLGSDHAALAGLAAGDRCLAIHLST
jgi:arginine/ornithine N-succinyltransferase beta subunit